MDTPQTTLELTGTVAERKIGTNKGKARIWLEGAILSDAGWSHKDRFNADFGAGALTYTRAIDGKRAVAGKPGRPIIDTNTDKIIAAIGAEMGATVTVRVSESTIVISAS